MDNTLNISIIGYCRYHNEKLAYLLTNDNLAYEHDFEVNRIEDTEIVDYVGRNLHVTNLLSVESLLDDDRLYHEVERIQQADLILLNVPSDALSRDNCLVRNFLRELQTDCLTLNIIGILHIDEDMDSNDKKDFQEYVKSKHNEYERYFYRPFICTFLQGAFDAKRRMNGVCAREAYTLSNFATVEEFIRHEAQTHGVDFPQSEFATQLPPYSILCCTGKG